MSVRVVVLGAGGLVGARLSQRLVELKEMYITSSLKAPISKLVLFDLRDPSAVLGEAVTSDPRVQLVMGDLTDAKTIADAIKPEAGDAHVTTIHLAALLSGYAEDNFDLGMKINLQGTINVMEQVRALKDIEQLGGRPQNYVYTSTDYVTAFNEHNKTHPCNEESFRLSPVSYGVQKACCELLLCDYSRKGFIDGRVARLSAVIGRPGFSNSISYPFTGIFTQPLEGKDYDVPLPMDIPYPCSSLETDVSCFIMLAGQVDAEALGHNRVVQLPAKSFTLNDLWAATQAVAKKLDIKIGSIRQVDGSQGKTSVTEINVCPVVSVEKAKSLGLPTDFTAEEIVERYYNTYVKK